MTCQAEEPIPDFLPTGNCGGNLQTGWVGSFDRGPSGLASTGFFTEAGRANPLARRIGGGGSRECRL